MDQNNTNSNPDERNAENSAKNSVSKQNTSQQSAQEEAKLQLPPEIVDILQSGRQQNNEDQKGQGSGSKQNNSVYEVGANEFAPRQDSDEEDNGDDHSKAEGIGQGSKRIYKTSYNKPNSGHSHNPRGRGGFQGGRGGGRGRGGYNRGFDGMGYNNQMGQAGGNQLTNQSFFKTQLCPHMQKGLCTKGEKCSYAHSQQELRDKPNLEKTKLCQVYKMGGNCPNGSNCKFAHGEHELRATPDFYKTQPCQNWMKGSCIHGNRCRYAHGENELRSSGSQRNGGGNAGGMNANQNYNYMNYQDPSMMQNYNAMYMNNPNMYMGGYQYDQSAYMNQYSQGQYNMGYQGQSTGNTQGLQNSTGGATNGQAQQGGYGQSYNYPGYTGGGTN